MRLNVAGGIFAALVLVALVIANSTLFTVYQTDQVLVVRLGEPLRVVTEPGSNFKLPLLDSVIDIDKGILDLENPSQEVIASDQKRLVIDAFARYRVNDALKFYQTIGAIEGADARLSTQHAPTMRPSVFFQKQGDFPRKTGRAIEHERAITERD
jgi:membrane protease subunit HflC